MEEPASPDFLRIRPARPRRLLCLLHRETLCQTLRSQAQGRASGTPMDPKLHLLTPNGSPSHHLGHPDRVSTQNFAANLSRGIEPLKLIFLFNHFLTSPSEKCKLLVWKKTPEAAPFSPTELGKSKNTYFEQNVVFSGRVSPRKGWALGPGTQGPHGAQGGHWGLLWVLGSPMGPPCGTLGTLRFSPICCREAFKGSLH